MLHMPGHGGKGEIVNRLLIMDYVKTRMQNRIPVFAHLICSELGDCVMMAGTSIETTWLYP